MNTDGNLDALNRHLDEIEEYEARTRRKNSTRLSTSWKCRSTTHRNASSKRAPQSKHSLEETKMRIRDIIGDIIGVIAIFGGGYALLIIGYGS